MKTSRIIAGFLVSLIIYSGTIGCEATYHSSFAAQSMKPSELAQVKYRMLKPGAMGESTGFKLLWIPISSPTESEAKRDMLDRLRKEGVETKGKNIGFANATADKGGWGFIGLIGAPAITLTADVVEVLGTQPAHENGAPPGQPARAGAP